MVFVYFHIRRVQLKAIRNRGYDQTSRYGICKLPHPFSLEAVLIKGHDLNVSLFLVPSLPLRKKAKEKLPQYSEWRDGDVKHKHETHDLRNSLRECLTN